MADGPRSAARSGRAGWWMALVVIAAVAGAVILGRGIRGWRSAPPGAVAVAMTEMAYLPAEIAVPAGRPVRVLLRNDGSLQHDFSIDALRLSPDVRPGEQRTVDLTAPAGRYEVYCTFPGHRAAGMVATLVAES